MMIPYGFSANKQFVNEDQVTRSNDQNHMKYLSKSICVLIFLTKNSKKEGTFGDCKITY